VAGQKHVIVVSFALWFVVVFGVRIAVWGNPLYRMVATAEVSLLTGVEALVLGQTEEGTPEQVRFVRAFSQGVLVQLGMLCLELAALAHLWWISVLPRLCLALLLKDLTAAGTGMWVAHRHRERGVLSVVRNAPAWLLLVERLSAGISAVGALVIFLTVNELRPW
jgi:hypothetical protein